VDTKGFKVGDRVRASFSIVGNITRFEKERFGVVAVLNTGEYYTRKVPVDNLRAA
jgi:hypothetical protein